MYNYAPSEQWRMNPETAAAKRQLIMGEEIGHTYAFGDDARSDSIGNYLHTCTICGAEKSFQEVFPRVRRMTNKMAEELSKKVIE
jgi:hypothetical protein